MSAEPAPLRVLRMFGSPGRPGAYTRHLLRSHVRDVDQQLRHADRKYIPPASWVLEASQGYGQATIGFPLRVTHGVMQPELFRAVTRNGRHNP